MDANIGLSYDAVRQLAVTPTGTVLAVSSGRLDRSTDRGDAWSADNSLRPKWIIADPAGTLFVGDVYWTQVWRSDDDGVTWTATSFPTLTSGVDAFVVDPFGQMFVTTGGINLHHSVDEVNWTLIPTSFPAGVGPLAIGPSGQAYMGFGRERRVSFRGLDHRRLHSEPITLALEQNRPNPFDPLTTIRFELVRRGHTTLRIYDVTGRLVRTLVDRRLDRDRHRVVWDGTDDSGRLVASGIYVYRLRAADFTAMTKMVVLR